MLQSGSSTPPLPKIPCLSLLCLLKLPALMSQDNSEIHTQLAASTASQPEWGPLCCCKGGSNRQQKDQGNRASDGVISPVT